MIIIKYADDESLINFLEYGTCKECNQINIEKDWCESYNSKRLRLKAQLNFHHYNIYEDGEELLNSF